MKVTESIERVLFRFFPVLVSLVAKGGSWSAEIHLKYLPKWENHTGGNRIAHH